MNEHLHLHLQLQLQVNQPQNQRVKYHPAGCRHSIIKHIWCLPELMHHWILHHPSTWALYKSYTQTIVKYWYNKLTISYITHIIIIFSTGNSNKLRGRTTNTLPLTSNTFQSIFVLQHPPPPNNKCHYNMWHFNLAPYKESSNLRLYNPIHQGQKDPGERRKENLYWKARTKAEHMLSWMQSME